jgi:hypothetical protein
MSANPLVAGPVDTSTAFGGAGLLESLTDLSSSLQSGDWVAAGLSGVGVALDTAAAVVDPFGSLIAAGLGWLMEHLEPLKGWLNDLTGDAGAVLGFAATWDNVAAAMTGAGDELNRVVTADLEGMSGASVLAYAAYANGLADRVRAAGASASAMGSALRTCSTVVQVVHDLVRDTLAQLVGSIISWAAELVLTVGLATPWVVSQVTARVGSLAARVGKSVTDVITSAKSLKNLLEAMKDALARLASGVRGRLPGGGGATPAPHAPTTPVSSGHHGGYSRPPRSPYMRDEWADETYEAMRADADLARDISTGHPSWSQSQVEQILDHLLHREHLMRDFETGELVSRRFDADPFQAEALLRLRSGRGTAEDELLLRHELAESDYVRGHPGADYHTAHEVANSVADWWSEVQRRMSR